MPDLKFDVTTWS